MANANIQRLLTDFGQQSREGQAGSTFGSRMAAAGRGFGQGMITNLGRAGAQSGIKAFENMDMRPASEKLNERLGQIDRTTPEGQAELIQIVAGTHGTGAAVQLQQQFDAQLANKKLAEDTAAANLVLRQSYLDIAVADGNSKLAKLIASGMPLEKIQDEMFKGSDAVVKALTSDERKSFDTLMESPVFEQLAEKIKEPSNFFTYVGNFSNELETVIYQRAKQLKQAGGMSDAQALKRALEETATNFPTKGGGGDGGDGGGSGGRKNRRLGGNVPESKTDDVFGKID